MWRSAVLFGALLVAAHLGLMLVPGLHLVTMLGPLAWMVLALLLPRILRVGEDWALRLGVPPGIGRYLAYVTVGVLVTPATAWAVDVIRFGSVDTPMAYLAAGVGGSLTGLKLAYSFVVLPALGHMLIPALQREPVSRQAERAGSAMGAEPHWMPPTPPPIRPSAPPPPLGGVPVGDAPSRASSKSDGTMTWPRSPARTRSEASPGPTDTPKPPRPADVGPKPYTWPDRSG